MQKIQLRDVKASLSAVVDDAMRGKPTVITRHGKRQAVILSYAEWDRLAHVPSFGRLLMAMPGEVPHAREKTPLRKADL
jgi:antitoxin Phd